MRFFVLKVLGLLLLSAVCILAVEAFTMPSDTINLASVDSEITVSSYVVLEPEIWKGKPLPILEHIDIADQLKTSNWLILLYHHDCPICLEAIAECEQIAKEFKGNEDFLKIALIEVPPYGCTQTGEKTSCTLGKLDDSKEWFATTPTVLLTQNSYVFRHVKNLSVFALKPKIF